MALVTRKFKDEQHIRVGTGKTTVLSLTFAISLYIASKSIGI